MHAGQHSVSAKWIRFERETLETGAHEDEIAGITRANEGMQGISWNILGQTYVPKNRTEHCFSWHATFPPGTFVPPHIHPDQDEYLYILEGKLDFMLDGADAQATPGDLVRLPMGMPHGIFNKSRPDGESAVLGVADPKALRSVLGHPQHEAAEARRRGGAGRRTQHPLPAAAAGGVRGGARGFEVVIASLDGQITKTLSSPFRKNILIFRRRKSP